MTDRSAVNAVKRSGRLLARDMGIPHRQALDMLAKNAGFSHWGAYLPMLEAGTSPRGWDDEGGFLAYPPLVNAVLSRDEVRCLAINEDGSAWVDTGTMAHASWSRLDPKMVDDLEVVSGMLDSLPPVLRNPSGLIFQVVTTDEGRKSDRLTAKTHPDDTRRPEATIRKSFRTGEPPISIARGWGMQDDRWDLHLLTTRCDQADERACEIVLRGKPTGSRLVGLGLDPAVVRGRNFVEARGSEYGDQASLDYAIRVSGDAFVAIVDTPSQAVAALMLASANQGPTAIAVDAPADDVVSHLVGLVLAGNVSPQHNVRQGVIGMLARMEIDHTIHT